MFCIQPSGVRAIGGPVDEMAIRAGGSTLYNLEITLDRATEYFQFSDWQTSVHIERRSSFSYVSRVMCHRDRRVEVITMQAFFSNYRLFFLPLLYLSL